jgi:hypothetical protein
MRKFEKIIIGYSLVYSLDSLLSTLPFKMAKPWRIKEKPY